MIIKARPPRLAPAASLADVLAQFEEARHRLSAARLYVISADDAPERQVTVLCAAIDGGAGVVQLRNKLAAPADLLDAARRVARHARSHGAVFIVNDDPDLVAASGADGVHLGQDDGAFAAARLHLPGGAVLGRSTHSIGQAIAAVAEGADYIGVGPVHATPTKPGRAPVGLELVREVSGEVTVPWFAIGGLDRGNLAEVEKAGATRVAVVRAVSQAIDPRSAAAELLALLQAGVPGVTATSEETFTVNGDTLTVGAIDTLGALLERLDIRPERVVIELNGTIYRRGEGLSQAVGGGDVVEIVHFVGGG